MTSEWQLYAAALRAARERLQNLRVDDPAIPVCIAGLSRIESMLRRPLRIVILGEYNSGKSSLTDLILGKGLLPISVVANTGVPVLVSYAESAALFGVDANGIQIRIDGSEDDALTDLDYRAVEIRLPLPWLQHHQLLDTPATQTPAVFAADADIAIWCTVATRAWTESDRNLWSTVPSRCHKHALLVATHKDSFYSDDDCAQVLRRLTSVSRGLFREVLLVSAADPDAENDEAGDPAETLASDAATVRAAIETSAQSIRERRLAKARRITRRLARLALYEFGLNAVRPEAAPALSKWNAVAEQLIADHDATRLSLDHALESLLHAFAHTAEVLRPGVIRGPARQSPLSVPIRTPEPPGYITTQRASVLKSDLTAVLRILATSSRYESPDVREQREAARATLLSLADLDGAFAELGRWLASHRQAIDTSRTHANA
jgi:hypothetical protein